MSNLRKQNDDFSRCIYTTHGSNLGRKEKPFTTQLIRGTASRAVEFAMRAAENEKPLNTLFTLRWDALFAEQAEYPYLSLPPRQRIAKSVELIRHFLTYRGLKFAWMWVQENDISNKGLHWHLAFYCPSEMLEELTDYSEAHFGIDRLPDYLNNDKRRGEVARSILNAWQLEVDIEPKWKGLYLALYLTKGEGRKAEFSDTIIRSAIKLQILNVDAFSVAVKKRHFHKPQGIIEGTQKDRFAISRIKF